MDANHPFFREWNAKQDRKRKAIEEAEEAAGRKLTKMEGLRVVLAQLNKDKEDRGEALVNPEWLRAKEKREEVINLEESEDEVQTDPPAPMSPVNHWAYAGSMVDRVHELCGISTEKIVRVQGIVSMMLQGRCFGDDIEDYEALMILGAVGRADEERTECRERVSMRNEDKKKKAEPLKETAEEVVLAIEDGYE